MGGEDGVEGMRGRWGDVSDFGQVDSVERKQDTGPGLPMAPLGSAGFALFDCLGPPPEEKDIPELPSPPLDHERGRPYVFVEAPYSQVKQLVVWSKHVPFKTINPNLGDCLESHPCPCPASWARPGLTPVLP